MSTALEAMTQAQNPSERKGRAVSWYRTPLEPAVLKKLHERSDLRGLMQALGYLGVLVATGTLAWYSAYHWPIWATVLCVFLHGTGYAFQINAVHELGHGTVFKTRWLNSLFEHIFAFLGWINFHVFDTGHVRHHQYTLHLPEDQEVVLPVKLVLKDFLRDGFVNPKALVDSIRNKINASRNKMPGPWSESLFPASAPEKRRQVVRWARAMLIGHGLILAVSIYFQWWMLPVLTTLAPFYGGWLFFLCNNTQHIGLQDSVNDFRLCCRTIYLNPFLRFLYWHMNWHTEHHMYAAVPCYRLKELNRLIQHDLPPCTRGLVATWKQIIGILRQQAIDPKYQYAAPLPTPTPKRSAAVAAS